MRNSANLEAPAISIILKADSEIRCKQARCQALLVVKAPQRLAFLVSVKIERVLSRAVKARRAPAETMKYHVNLAKCRVKLTAEEA